MTAQDKRQGAPNIDRIIWGDHIPHGWLYALEYDDESGLAGYELGTFTAYKKDLVDSTEREGMAYWTIEEDGFADDSLYDDGYVNVIIRLWGPKHV